MTDDYEFTIDCAYCEDPLMVVTGANAQAWKRDAAAGGHAVSCPDCGCKYAIIDDGVSVEMGGGIIASNISAPRLDSLDIASGSATGGYVIVIRGSALDVGTLVVKFGGKDVLNITNRTKTAARVTLPQGQYKLDVAEVTTPGFIVGEGIYGTDSGARGVVKSIKPFVVNAPTLPFDPNEEVVGVASGSRLVLSGSPYSGAVDVTVENEHGQRVVGGAVLNGFTYV